jgi:hypothetical protein
MKPAGLPRGPGFVIVPSKDHEIDDNWQTVGLCGTGSKTIVIREPLFVPATAYSPTPKQPPTNHRAHASMRTRSIVCRFSPPSRPRWLAPADRDGAGGD